METDHNKQGKDCCKWLNHVDRTIRFNIAYYNCSWQSFTEI